MYDSEANMVRLMDLTGKVCNREASEDDYRDLNALLLEDEEYRRRYLTYCRMHALLRREVRASRAAHKASRQICEESNVVGPCDLDLAKSESIPPASALFPSAAFHGALHFFTSGWPAAYLIATVIFAVGALIGSFVYVSQPTQFVDQQHASNPHSLIPNPSSVVARITHMVDCKWDDSSGSFTSNRLTRGRKLGLVSGLVEITYESGAKVILQGPSTYEVASHNSGFLTIGKLTGKVETAQAKGFAIHTPMASVIDLGTEFGVEVNDSGATFARVYHGRVDVQAAVKSDRHGPRSIRLSENESVRIEMDPDGKDISLRQDAPNSVDFVRFAELPALAEQSRMKPYRRWWEYSQKLRSDPTLLAYYDFQQEQGRPSVLPNLAANADRSLDGVIQQAAWTNGRMPGKHALLFQGTGDCVELYLPQTVDELTLAAWVNVAALHEDLFEGQPVFNSLLMSDGWDRAGQLHWQIAPDGRVCLGRFPKAGLEGSLWRSSAVFDSSHLQRWTHVAVVVDRSSRVKFYIDGQLTDDVPAENVEHTPIHIGAARIGVWNREPRTLNGKIDELAIWNRPLEADEIRLMFDAGKPNVEKQQ